MATRIQFRRGTEAEWTSTNPILAEGELGLELDTGRFKVGVGTTSWTNLQYAFENIDELNVTGIATVGSLSIGSTQVISSARQLQNIVSLDATTTATIESAVAAAPNDFTSLNIIGISTLNGLVDINNDVDISGNLKVVGISTLNNVVVGGATTALIVSGNARIIGILTIGTSSITLNGFNNQVNVGSATTITADGFQVGENTLYSTGLTVNNINSTGIITANSFSGTVTGTATSTTNIPNLSGDITSANTITTLATVNSNVGSFGSQTLIPVVTVNAKGLVTAVTTADAITGLTIRDEGNIVGGANSVSQLNFVGNIISVASTSGIATITLLDYVSNSGVSTSVIGGIASVSQLQVTGVSTFTNGPILVGSASSTGTSSQRLQVTGGAYVSGNLGIGTTTPTSKLTVVGDVLVSGILTANRLFSGLYGEFVGGSISGTNIVGTALSISGISTLGTVRISSGIVTATSGIVTYYGDGQYLSGVVSPESNGEFYTGVSSSLQLKPLSYETTVFTFPSTAGKQYVIESINAANVDTSVGVGTTVNIIASIQDTSGEQTYIAYNVPVVNGGLIELLKNAMVAGPSDAIKMWITDGNYAGVNNAVEVYMNFTEFTSTEYIREYASTVSIATTNVTGIFTSTTYPSVIESIHLANRTDIGDYPVSVTITNGVTTTFLAKDLLIPRYSTVDILDRPKRIELNGTLGIKVGQTSTIDVIIAGKQIT